MICDQQFNCAIFSKLTCIKHLWSDKSLRGSKLLEKICISAIHTYMKFMGKSKPFFSYIARLVLAARQRDHISPLLQSLHWLRVVERITFRLAVLTYRCLHGSAPEYLSRQLQRVPDVCMRRRLRSSSSTALVISRTVRATIGNRGFSAAATSVWNSLPEAVRSSASLALFRKSLKTELFSRSCSD